MDFPLAGLLNAVNQEQLMAATRSVSVDMGQPRTVRLDCRADSPLLLEIRSHEPESDAESIARSNAFAKKLGGIPYGVDGVLKLLQLRPEFRCPGRDGNGNVIDGSCHRCYAQLTSL